MTTDQVKKCKGQTSLAPLLRFMEGLGLSIELKNGRVYRGTLQSADAFMNIVLQQVQRCPRRCDAGGGDSEHPSEVSGNPMFSLTPQTDQHPTARSNEEELTLEEYDLVHIRGPWIRYIHFPDAADIPALIKVGENRERAAADRYRRGKRKSPS